MLITAHSRICSGRVKKQTAESFPVDNRRSGRRVVFSGAGIEWHAVTGFDFVIQPINFAVQPFHRFAADGQVFEVTPQIVGLDFDQPTMGSPVTCGAERVQLYSYRQETAYPEHMHEDWQRSLRIVQEIQDNMTRYSCDTTDKLGYYQRRAIRNAPGVTCPDMERRVQGLNHRMQMTVEDARLHMASQLGVDAFSRAIEGKTEDERIAIYLNFDRGSVSFGMYDVYQSQLERVMNELRQPPCSILSNDMVEIDTERAAQLSRCERLSHEMDSARYQADELDPSRVPARVRELEDQLDACFDAAASGEGTAWGSGQWGAGPIPRPGASQTR